MGKDILGGVPVALMAVVTILSAQTATTIDQTKQTDSRASRTSATPDLPLDTVGMPDPSLAAEFEPLSNRCLGLLDLKTRFRITGTMHGRRVDVELRLGLAAGAAIRLEPVVPSGSPLFVLQANYGSDNQQANEHGTLFIRQGNRVVRDKLSALIEAVIGLPINEQELFEIFTGCPTSWSSADLYRLGSDWFKLLTPYGDDAVLETYWLRDRSHPWTYSAAIHYTLSAPERKWRIDFLEGRHEVFVRLRIRSMNWLGELDRQDDITLLREFAWIDANGIQGAATIPAAAREISLVELKSAIPLITTPSIQRSPSPQARQPARR